MSGGSWDYVYRNLEEAAERLGCSDDPLRRALGQRMALMATAMHDIEWVDSSDYARGDELVAIKAALDFDGLTAVMSELRNEAERGLRAIAKICADVPIKPATTP